MDKLSLVSLAAVAACSGAPVIQQSAPTTPETDPQTEAEVTTALKTAELIKDKCIGLIPDGEISFGVEERGEKVITTLGITKGSQNGDAITEETCECVYRIDIPTFVHEKTSCEYSYSKVVEYPAMKIEEYTGTDRISHTEKADGRSSSRTILSERATGAHYRKPWSTIKPGLITEISANGSGCRTSTYDENGIPDKWVNIDDQGKTPYDPTKLGSCEYFATMSSIFMSEVKNAICEQLKREGVDNPPPLCAGGKVYAPAK